MKELEAVKVVNINGDDVIERPCWQAPEIWEDRIHPSLLEDILITRQEHLALRAEQFLCVSFLNHPILASRNEYLIFLVLYRLIGQFRHNMGITERLDFPTESACLVLFQHATEYTAIGHQCP